MPVLLMKQAESSCWLPSSSCGKLFIWQIFLDIQKAHFKVKEMKQWSFQSIHIWSLKYVWNALMLTCGNALDDHEIPHWNTRCTGVTTKNIDVSEFTDLVTQGNDCLHGLPQLIQGILYEVFNHNLRDKCNWQANKNQMSDVRKIHMNNPLYLQHRAKQNIHFKATGQLESADNLRVWSTIYHFLSTCRHKIQLPSSKTSNSTKTWQTHDITLGHHAP